MGLIEVAGSEDEKPTDATDNGQPDEEAAMQSVLVDAPMDNQRNHAEDQARDTDGGVSQPERGYAKHDGSS
jgi:hypothetical protein